MMTRTQTLSNRSPATVNSITSILLYKPVGMLCHIRFLLKETARLRWILQIVPVPTTPQQCPYTHLWTFPRTDLFRVFFYHMFFVNFHMAVWLSGKSLVSINLVWLRRAWLLMAQLTVCGRVNHLITLPSRSTQPRNATMSRRNEYIPAKVGE